VIIETALSGVMKKINDVRFEKAKRRRLGLVDAEGGLGAEGGQLSGKQRGTK
jgi:hypothetical protein